VNNLVLVGMAVQMNILVCTDLTELSENVLAKAQEIACATSAKLWIIHIVSPDPDFIGYEQAELSQTGVLKYKIESQSNSQNIRKFISEKLHQNHRKVQTLSANIRNEGIDTTGLMIQGAIVKTILKQASKLNVDMIILGSQQHSFIHQCILGSISNEVIHNANVPILVVPNGST
jgi:nucleotide-binding universal stress UspA family protein